MSIGELIFNSTKESQNFEAIRYDNKSITYFDLNDKALSIASLLSKMGFYQSVIGIVGQKNLSPYVGLLGSLYAGCSYTPINTKYSNQRIKDILEACSIKVIIGSKIDLTPLLPIFEKFDVLIICVDGSIDYKNVESLGKRDIERAYPLSNPKEVDDNFIAYILFTSGSSGKPKGVQVTHGNVIAFILNMKKLYTLDKGYKASHTFDLSFDLSVCDIFFTWSNSGTLCVLPENEKLIPTDYIQREKIEFWFSVPTLASFMDKFDSLKEDIFPSLKYSLFCGEPLPILLAKKWSNSAKNSTVENVYGPTEATIHLTRRIYSENDVNSNFSNGIVPIGRAFDDHIIEIIDENDNRIPRGNVGEIVFKGPQISKGYLNDEKKTKAFFVNFIWDKSSDVWYKSGDLGFYNNDGDIECLGRIDNQIKFAGRRVDIGEIEFSLRRYPELDDLIIVPLRDNNLLVKSLIGFTTNFISIDQENKLRLESQYYLEKIFFPAKIISIEKFPTTHSGKIDKKVLIGNL